MGAAMGGCPGGYCPYHGTGQDADSCVDQGVGRRKGYRRGRRAVTIAGPVDTDDALPTHVGEKLSDVRVPSSGSRGSSIHDAARSGDVAAVRALLAAKCDLQKVDENGLSPFYVAIEHAQVGVLRLLLEAKCNSATTVWPPVDVHREHPNWSCVQVADFLVPCNRGRNVRTGLNVACVLGHANVAKVLATEDPFYDLSARCGTRFGYGDGPLFHAVNNGNSDCVRVLLEAKADATELYDVTGKYYMDSQRQRWRRYVVEPIGWSPLFVAAYHGHVDIVRLLDAAAPAMRRVATSASYLAYPYGSTHMRVPQGSVPIDVARLRNHAEVVALLSTPCT
jgi:ankyrin repeat protein